MIVWAEGARQCLLWAVDNRLELRIYDGPLLIHSEPMTPGASSKQSSRLRALYGLRDLVGDSPR